MTEEVTLSPEQFDQLVSGLKLLARIPIPDDEVGDDWPLMEAGGQFIRAGHVREARAVLLSFVK